MQPAWNPNFSARILYLTNALGKVLTDRSFHVATNAELHAIPIPTVQTRVAISCLFSVLNAKQPIRDVVHRNVLPKKIQVHPLPRKNVWFSETVGNTGKVWH